MRKRPIAAISLAALLVLPLAACSANQSGGADTSMQSMDMASEASSVAQSPEVMRDGADSYAGEVATQGQSVIRSGGVSISVSDVREAADAVNALALDLGGYVESETQYGGDSGSVRGADLTIRVPADRFEASFQQLDGIGEVLSENRSAIDVTSQHVDLKARAAALEESITRLTELMRGATTTSDLLEAESALAERQQELDGLNAQLKALEGQVSLASIWVNLSTESVIPGGPGNFWDGLVAGWNSLLQALAGAVVIAGILIPWLVPVLIIAGVIWWIARRNRKRRGMTAGTPAPTPAPAPGATSPAPSAADSPVATYAAAQATRAEAAENSVDPGSTLEK